MSSQSVETRRLGLWAAACAVIATVLLGVGITLNERAVALENGITGDASYEVAVALVVALVAGALALRFALSPGRAILQVAIIAAVLAVLAAAGAGFLVLLQPVSTQIFACEASRQVWLAVYTGPTPNACGYPAVPESEYSYFYPAMYLAWGAAALFVVSIVPLVRAGGRVMAGRPDSTTRG